VPYKDRQEITVLLYLAYKKTQGYFYRIAESYGLAPAQLAALKKLWENDGIKNTTLGEQLFLKTSTVTTLIDRMERDGLVYRERGRKDRRVVNIWLTEKGRGIKDEVPDIESLVVKKMETEFTEAEIKEFIRLLKKFLKTMTVPEN